MASATGIERGIVVTGDITATEDITLGGEVTGKITIPDHRLAITPGARVQASVVARSVEVAGWFDGTIVAAERVHLLPGAEVRGHLTTPALHLVEGAVFTGTVDPHRTEAAMRVARYRERHPA